MPAATCGSSVTTSPEGRIERICVRIGVVGSAIPRFLETYRKYTATLHATTSSVPDNSGMDIESGIRTLLTFVKLIRECGKGVAWIKRVAKRRRRRSRRARKRASSRYNIMADKRAIIPMDRIERTILLIRGEKVILDTDLAALYGVPTKALNQAVKRNRGRFPPDFMFRLTRREKTEVVTNCDHLQGLKFSPGLPAAFTEHGAIMAASVLNSERAVEVSVAVVRTFVRLRKLLATHADLARKLDAMEKKYDGQFRVVFDAIRRLMAPPAESKRPAMGYLAIRSRD